MKYCLYELAQIDCILRAARRILIASDFDGTLCAIADSPADVHLSPAMLGILRRIASSPAIRFAVISGRAIVDICGRVPLGIAFSGNHGLEIRGYGLDFEHSAARERRPLLATACSVLAQTVERWPGAWIEDKGLSATLHYRKVDPRQHRAIRYEARQLMRRFGARFSLRAGNQALELRPKLAWDKGSALNYIREHTGPFDACICIGDDRTDETMFRANRGCLNIRVGRDRPSAAGYYLSSPAEVAIFLSHILDLCEFRSAAAGMGQASRLSEPRD